MISFNSDVSRGCRITATNAYVIGYRWGSIQGYELTASAWMHAGGLWEKAAKTKSMRDWTNAALAMDVLLDSERCERC